VTLYRDKITRGDSVINEVSGCGMKSLGQISRGAPIIGHQQSQLC